MLVHRSGPALGSTYPAWSVLAITETDIMSMCTAMMEVLLAFVILEFFGN